MKKEIYAVILNDYGDKTVEGYFTVREDADKYCAKHSEWNYIVKTIACYDKREDLSDVKLKYEYRIIFDRANDLWITANKNEQYYEAYCSEYLRSNSIHCDISNSVNKPEIVEIFVNTENNDIKFAEEIARDLLSKFLEMCNEQLPKVAAKNMNVLLSAEENERKRKQKEEELKQKELAELKRLKEKYENT